MRLASLALACLVACTPTSEPDDRTGTPPAAPSSAAATDEPRPPSTCVGSDNPVDVAACPTLARARCAAAPAASTHELCRRLHVDLTGIAPTPEQIANVCAGRSPHDIAVALMATPAFVTHSKELWGETLRYDPAMVDGKWLADADGYVDALVRGALGYDAFARRIVGHPVLGLGARFPRSDVLEDDVRFFPQVADRAFRVFLGRAPVAGEADAFAHLFRFWRKDIMVLNGDYGRAEAMIDPDACPCSTTLFGALTTITPPFASYADYDPANASLAAELDKAGALLGTQDAFWTQGADLALAMLLGWWKTTTALDESMIPEISQALGERLRASKSWPELVLDIVTSTLYVRSNHVADGAPDDLRVYCAGPFRVMRPEAYVASLGRILGVTVGRCDHRTSEKKGVFYPDGSEGSFFPNALREDEPSDIEAFGVDDYHWLASTGMGGCSAGAPRSEEPSLPLVFGAAPTASDVCAASKSLLTGAKTDKSDAAVRTIADGLAKRLLGRVLTDSERAAIASDAAPCVADAACTAQDLAAEMCSAMARSIDATTY